jgi:hypothetical protein
VRWLLLATSAPGTFRAQETQPELSSRATTTTIASSARGKTAGGYEVEVRIPLVLVGARLE